MPVSRNYQEFVLDQLEHVDDVTDRRMFGGVGLYSAEHFFALIDDDRLYLKVDDSNRADFEKEGMGPFRPYGDERSMQYYEVPVSVLEDKEALGVWARKAVAVAERAKSRKPKRGKKR